MCSSMSSAAAIARSSLSAIAVCLLGGEQDGGLGGARSGPPLQFVAVFAGAEQPPPRRPGLGAGGHAGPEVVPDGGFGVWLRAAGVVGAEDEQTAVTVEES